MTSKSAVTLRAKRVQFFSQHDEDAFFYWLERLKPFATARGEGDSIMIDVATDTLDDDQLRELLALCHRYQIDMRSLLVFENRGNMAWLRNKRAYWHQAMFEIAPAA